MIKIAHLRAEKIPLKVDPSKGAVHAEGERYRSTASRAPPRQPLGFLIAPADGVVAEVEVSHGVVGFHSLRERGCDIVRAFSYRAVLLKLRAIVHRDGR